MCLALLIYQLLIPWGPTPDKQQPNLLGLSPSSASSDPRSWYYPTVAKYISASFPYYSWNTIEYGVLQEREEGKDEKV